MTIKWDESLATGIEELDNQHKEIINRVKQLLNACIENNSHEKAINMVDFLETYILEHFGLEERIMKKSLYPYFVSHMAEHDYLKTIVANLRIILNKEGPNSHFIVYMNRKLVEWLLFHINREDKLIADYLRKQKQTPNTKN